MQISSLGDGLYDVPPGKLATVVTHLEMRAPAPLRQISMPNGVSFSLASNPDPDWYRDLFDRVGGQGWLWFSRLRMDNSELSVILSNPGVDVYTVTKDGRTEGLLELDFRQGRACELAFLGLTAKLIGSGAGRFLMNEAITRAWARDIDLFHVHTCTLDHPDALGFYIRSGFTPVRQQIEIENDPRVTGEFPKTAGPRVPIFPVL